MTTQDELAVLFEQLQELLHAGIEELDDAVEIATVAGLAERLGGQGPALDQAAALREEVGLVLLQDALDEVDVDDLVATLEDAASAGAEAQVIEDALADLDDYVVACAWARQADQVRSDARRVTDVVHTYPDAFTTLAGDARELARLPSLAEDIDLYGYWLAIADLVEPQG